jgi:hypothetical protein
LGVKGVKGVKGNLLELKELRELKELKTNVSPLKKAFISGLESIVKLLRPVRMEL